MWAALYIGAKRFQDGVDWKDIYANHCENVQCLDHNVPIDMLELSTQRR